MDNQEAKEILERYRKGLCTEEEKAWVESWYLKAETGSSDVSHEEIEAAMAQVRENLNRYDRQPHRLWPRIAAAASVIVAVSVSAYFFLNKPKTDQVLAVKSKTEIMPGGYKAYLTLGNGQRISLTDAKNGKIASEAGKSIQKTADGKLVYDDSHSSHNIAEVVFNKIETPRGGQYQVVLPDGSKVWLNAASSLRYPAAFTGADREVELTGEAYFEVAKDKAHPFRVKTDKESVEVLGTHFNINNYSDEPVVRTTLLEGSVKISAGSNQRVIKPGDQAVLSGEKLKVQDADEEEVLAWKNGQFIFNDEPLESIMRKVARWYDVEVQYAENVNRSEAFGGGVSRYSSVGKVLEKLESTRLVHFRIQGRMIYVSK